MRVEQGTTNRDYVGSVVYENGSLKRVLIDGGYIEGGTYYYLNDHLGNVRVVASGTGTILQRNEYYPFGMPMAETANSQQEVQPYKFGAKEFDRKNGLNWMDFGARNYDAALGRFMTMDRFAEKYYSLSPYQYAANNPMRNIDVNGDSLYVADAESILAIYHGLEDGANVKLNFNNGVLDPSSIKEAAESSSDFFLKDLYEIASHQTMVELSTSNYNTYMMDGKQVREEFLAPVDDDTSNYGSQYESLLKSVGEPLGKSITGNLGQTLMPGNISASGKSSTNGNVQVIINGKGKINHQTVGIAHEW